MPTRYTCLVAAILALVSATASPLRAELLVTNYTDPLADAGSVGLNAVTDYRLAQQFSTDSQTWLDPQVTVRIAYHEPMRLELFSDNGNEPGTFIAGQTAAVAQPTPGDVTFSLAGVTLDPATDYWLVLSAPSVSGGNYFWYLSFNDMNQGPGVLYDNTVPDLGPKYSFDSGTTWANANLVLARAFLTEINATVVPEPNTIILLTVGLGSFAAMVFCRQRRRN